MAKQENGIPISSGSKFFSVHSVNRLSYRDSGYGERTLLFLHEFADYSRTWEDMMPFMPNNFRYIRVDMNGYAAPGTDEWLSNYDQAELLKRFILELNLKHLTIIGHGIGAEIAVLLLGTEEILARTEQLVLIAPSLLSDSVYPHIESIAQVSPKYTVFRFTHSKLIARMILGYAYSNTERLKKSTLNEYADMVSQPERIQTIIKAARDYRLPNKDEVLKFLDSLKIPVLLIWGDKDKIVPLKVILAIQRRVKNIMLEVLHGCGHIPHQEFPEETADLISYFITEKRIPEIARKEEREKKSSEYDYNHDKSLKMSRLFDRWNLGTVILVMSMKILQFFRRLGVKAEEHGWRKITGAFLQNEYSKFILGSFKLTYLPSLALPPDLQTAKSVFISRFSDFLMTKSELHWSLEMGFMYFRRKKLSFCDLVEAVVDFDGSFLSLTPHLDPRYPDISGLSDNHTRLALEEIMRTCNRFKNDSSKQRPIMISIALEGWVKKTAGFNFSLRKNLNFFIERIMTAVFIYSEILPADPEEREKLRFETPDLIRYRHPGWGLIRIVARFSADYSDVDLWWQFHHVAVDGAPMQEILTELKQLWGASGQVVYPALNYTFSNVTTMDCGGGIWRARFYADFSQILKIRKYLNANYLNRMNGPTSLAGLVMWGLACNDFFKNQKMLLPVDLGTPAGERELGLLFIRPGNFRKSENPLDNFIAFQKEMNRRLNGTRSGRSESHEFLALCTMLHPFFYHFFRFIAPKSLNEIVGTMGISIIRDAEMFISPLTDFQINGFMSIGSVSMPTANGKKAGAVCICGSRFQIRFYLQALKFLLRHLPEALELPPDWERNI